MKIFKRLISLVLCLLICFSAFSLTGSAAAPKAPVFTLAVVSQNEKTVKLVLSLTEGSFSTFDFMLITGPAVKSCESLTTTDEFDDYCLELRRNKVQIGYSSYAVTQKMSFAATGVLDRKISICEIVLNKNSSADISANDISLAFSECVLSDASSEYRFGGNVKVNYVFGAVSLSEHNISIQYKKSAKLTAESTYSKPVVWSSSNENVARVDSEGNISTCKRGSAVITCTSPDGSVTDSCQVTVTYSVLQWIIIIVLFGWIWY